MRTALALLVLTACAPATTVTPVSARVSNGPAAAQQAAHLLTAAGYEVEGQSSTEVTSAWREMDDDASPYMARWHVTVSGTSATVWLECKMDGKTCARVPHAGRWQEQADDIASRLGS